MKDTDFCNRLRSRREAAQITQSDLEKSSELPLSVISQYENGTRQPGLQAIKSLCRGLKCTATELLGV